MPMTDDKVFLPDRQRVVFELREMRIEKKMSQQTLADRIGTKRSNVCRMELGHQNISLDMLFKIAAALGKTVTVTFQNENENQTG